MFAFLVHRDLDIFLLVGTTPFSDPTLYPPPSPSPCASTPDAQATRGVFRAVPCHILPISPLFFPRLQSTMGLPRAVTCHKRDACTREGGGKFPWD